MSSKNLGQSLIATTLFSNNILLGLTSGYWDLASEFKPLLHTWSLGVEEQYYLITPIMLMFAWKYSNKSILWLLIATCAASLIFAAWYLDVSPKWAFYILPTRAWEITMGGLCAITIRSNSRMGTHKLSNLLALIGSALVIGSVFAFDSSIPAPGPFLLIPTFGACLIILFAWPGTVTYMLLASRPVVFLGLISYSLYLWHQPVFAFIRIYSAEKPDTMIFAIALVVVLGFSYLSWKLIETPFRNKTTISHKGMMTLALSCSMFFIVAGLYLNKSYGLPQRVFDTNIRIEDMDKRLYNERVRSYIADQFEAGKSQKLLIVGNSFARDFLNITLESYDTSKMSIVYRDDLDQCIHAAKPPTASSLFQSADIIVFGSGELKDKCLNSDIEFAKSNGKKIFYVGTKDFGHNLNWIIRFSGDDRALKYNEVSQIDIATDARMSKAIPAEHYISLLGAVMAGNKIPITDERGRMITTDRRHLTKYGALYFGRRAVIPSSFSAIFYE